MFVHLVKCPYRLTRCRTRCCAFSSVAGQPAPERITPRGSVLAHGVEFSKQTTTTSPKDTA